LCAEANYYKELISADNNNLRALWGIFGSVINPHKMKRKNKINKLIVNNKTVNSDKDMADAFNDHFTSVGERLANEIKEPETHRKYLSLPIELSFFLSPTSTEEVLKQIKKT
jgi:hypothetical protein